MTCSTGYIQRFIAGEFYTVLFHQRMTFFAGNIAVRPLDIKPAVAAVYELFGQPVFWSVTPAAINPGIGPELPLVYIFMAFLTVTLQTFETEHTSIGFFVTFPTSDAAVFTFQRKAGHIVIICYIPPAFQTVTERTTFIRF